VSALQTGFVEITWDDLTAWAGSKIVSRGRSYKSKVRELHTTPEGGLLAWVHGTEVYATHVWLDQSGRLYSACSCPYNWGPCKHSVALILVYLDALKKKETICEASPDDQRLLLLFENGHDDNYDELETWDYDDDGGSEDLKDEDEREDEEDLAHRGSRSAKTKTNQRTNALRNVFEAMTKKDLVEFIMDLTERYPGIGNQVLEEEQLKSGRVNKIVQSIRHEIKNLSSEPAWSDHWSDEDNIPDYSRVCQRLESLLKSGHADEVVHLGEDLWRLGNEQVGMSHDEGETGEEIARCMEIVFRAVPESSLSPVDQMLWMINAIIEDDYSILEGVEDCISDPRYNKTDWSQVADALLTRLDKFPKPKKQDAYSIDYKREQIMHWAIKALENSGRTAEVIPLLEGEAPITHCYSTLIDHLLSAGRKEDAQKVAVDGFRKTINQLPGLALNLEKKLCEIAQSDKNFPLVAAYRALEFFHRPSLETYRSLEKAAHAMGEWPGVREAVIHFLETGVRPDMPQATGKKKNSSPPPTAWALPATEISPCWEKHPNQEYPDTNTLIDIAIHEKRNDEVIHWYEISKKGKFRGYINDDSVAEAVQASHPDVSLKIWQQLAEGQINLVKPAAYRVAANYLRKMQKIYKRLGRVDEWQAYLTGIRTQHKAKRTLMQTLDSLEGKRIIDL